MKNGNNDISSLEEQMANNDDICCSCGIVTAFPKAFFDNYRVAGRSRFVVKGSNML